MEIPAFDPKSNQECHKKVYYDLPSMQIKLGITKFQLEEAWAKRVKDEPVYLCYAVDRHFWISNYQ